MRHERSGGPGVGKIGRRAGYRMARREWLGGMGVALAMGLAPGIRAEPPKRGSLTPDDERAVAGVRDQARKAGLGELQVRWTDHFVGVGNAPPEEYIVQALRRCEPFSREFLDHFAKHGFTLRHPAHRMMVVALKDDDSYQKYSGESRAATVGGHYDLDTNQLVVFDFRPQQADLAAGAKRVNTFTLIHETAHMLCYNTGLLPPGGEVPVAISEGLATYAELWTPPRPRERSSIGRVNQPRLAALDEPDAVWIPIARLLADDGLFDNPKTENLAYAEAWLLVHDLMQKPESLPRFRAYLAGLPKPGGKVGREATAESALGSLRDLDADVRRHARRVRSRPR